MLLNTPFVISYWISPASSSFSPKNLGRIPSIKSSYPKRLVEGSELNPPILPVLPIPLQDLFVVFCLDIFQRFPLYDRHSIVDGLVGLSRPRRAIKNCVLLQKASVFSPLSAADVVMHLLIHHEVSRSMYQADPGALYGPQTKSATISDRCFHSEPGGTPFFPALSGQAEPYCRYNEQTYPLILDSSCLQVASPPAC